MAEHKGISIKIGYEDEELNRLLDEVKKAKENLDTALTNLSNYKLEIKIQK